MIENTLKFSEHKIRFGKHIRSLRERIVSLEYPNRNISQQELSDRRGLLSKKTIGEIERGEANPTFETLIALAIVLEVSFTELFDYD